MDKALRWGLIIFVSLIGLIAILSGIVFFLSQSRLYRVYVSAATALVWLGERYLEHPPIGLPP